MLSVSAQRVRVGNSLSTPNIYNTTSERGLIAINNSATGSSAGLINISGEVGTSAILVAQNTDSDYVSVFEARDEVDAVLFNIKSDGNVGIGATDPVTRLDVNGAIRTRPVTVATLPSAALGDGMRHCVTNASVSHTAGIGTIVAGGGANKVPVISFGGQWYIG